MVDCSHEIKRHLLLGRKTMSNLESILKSRDITLLTKVHLVKAMVFPISSVQSLSYVWLFATHWLQHARLPCPSPTLGACSNACPSSQWCHPTISSSVIPFSSCLESFPTSGFSNESALCSRWPKYWSFSFIISPSNEYSGWFPIGLTSWISLKSKGLSRVSSNTTVQKH